MEAVVEFKKLVASASILGIVVCKFSHWQEACPVILLQVHKGFEVYFHCAVLSLSLAIGLKMESSKESSLDS